MGNPFQVMPISEVVEPALAASASSVITSLHRKSISALGNISNLQLQPLQQFNSPMPKQQQHNIMQMHKTPTRTPIRRTASGRDSLGVAGSPFVVTKTAVNSPLLKMAYISHHSKRL